MTAPPRHRSPPGWTRFRHGAFECTVVTDGQLHMGAPREQFPDADSVEVAELLFGAHLPDDRMDLEQNLLVVNAGGRLVLFDSGSGIDRTLGIKTFGAGVGQAIPNLRQAGLEPEQIDVVALTHTHPDHCWGLVDEDGRMLYPNASIAVGGIDFDYWTDLSILETEAGHRMSEHMRDHFRGAHKNLLPYSKAGRLTRLSDGDEVIPGITAHLRAGHSPGHLIYDIESEGQRMTVWGDISHHPVLLLTHPEWRFVFDHDGNAAAESRLRVFEDVIATRSSVFAFHFAFPGRGHLQRVDGHYIWLPMPPEVA